MLSVLNFYTNTSNSSPAKSNLIKHIMPTITISDINILYYVISDTRSICLKKIHIIILHSTIKVKK